MEIVSLESPQQFGSVIPRAHRPPTFPFPKQNRKIEKPNFNTIIANRQRDFIRQQSVELKANTHSENQQFLKEIVANVLDGLGIGWLKQNRVKKNLLRSLFKIFF